MSEEGYKILPVITMDAFNQRIYSERATFKTMHEGSTYSLKVLKFVRVDFMNEDACPKLDGQIPFIFQTKAWWVEGASWFIAKRYQDANEELQGPFNNVDECMMYLLLMEQPE